MRNISISRKALYILPVLFLLVFVVLPECSDDKKDDPIPPTVESVTFTAPAANITSITITFSTAINPATFTYNSTNNTCAGYSVMMTDVDYTGTNCYQFPAATLTNTGNKVFTITGMSITKSSALLRITTGIVDAAGTAMAGNYDKTTW